MTTKLTRPSVVADLLGRYGLRPHKGLGQNFLVDEQALLAIVAAAELAPEDFCLEIGPGLGTLTRELASRAGQVVAIEKDRKLTPVLAETLAGCGNVSLIWGDALETDMAALIPTGVRALKVVANLPYYVTTPILMSLLESRIPWERMVFLVQKEVAERMVAAAGTGAYGAITVALRYWGDAEIAHTVPPRAFFPPPKVSSAVLVIRVRPDPAAHFGLMSERVFFALVRGAFGQRRKTLLNALSGAPGLPGRETLQRALESAGIDGRRRGETLPIEDFVRLANAITPDGGE